MGVTFVSSLIDIDGGILSFTIDQSHGILRIDIHARDLLNTLSNLTTQLTLVDITVTIVDIAVISDETDSAVLQQITIHPVTQVAIDHNDLALALGQAESVSRSQVIEGRFHLSLAIAAVQVTLTSNVLAVNGQNCFVHSCHLHGESFDLRFQTQLLALLLQILSALEFLRGTAGADISGLTEDIHDFLFVHNDFLLNIMQ